MAMRFPRLATRAVIVQDHRLLLVNAFAGQKSKLWCAPGGGVFARSDLHANLRREVWEETGLRIKVGDFLAVNEFHNPKDGFHQIDLFFRAEIIGGELTGHWKDPGKVVNKRQFFSAAEMEEIPLKPDCLREIAFAPLGPAVYDPLEIIVR